jgi:predicted amidophosphoribosyltransferase
MSQTPTFKKCPVCLGEDYGLFQRHEELLCANCLRLLERTNNPHILYIYNDFFKNILFRYKGLGDLALHSIFLQQNLQTLKRRYKGYIIVLVPSNQEDNFRRGFAFLPWIFKSLGLPMMSPFTKQIQYKQTSSKHREDISKVIVLKEPLCLIGQKVLLVDDVMTSGHTLKTCLTLLVRAKPKKLDYLVLACRKENIIQSIKLIEEGRILK